MQNIGKSENHVENNRAAKGSYFFQDVKSSPTPVSNYSSGLIAKESAAGITYDDKFAQLIKGETDAGGRFYQLLVANQPIGDAVNDYVYALEAKLKVSKKLEDVIRLIDYFVIVGNIEEALRICKNFNIEHDIIKEDSVVDKKSFVESLSRWAALCLSPISRSIARSCIYHLVLEDAFQIQLKEYADLIDAKDALIFASSILGNKHPVTNLLHEKWIAEVALTPTQASVQPTVDQIDLQAIAASNADLVGSYRAVVCLLAKPVNVRFNTIESLGLRQKYLEAIVAGKWGIVGGIGADIAKERCGSTDYLGDTLVLLSTVAELVAAILDVPGSSDQSPIRKLVEGGASLKDVFKNGDLATTIFVKNHAEYNEEVDQIAGSVDIIFRTLRSTSKKLQLSEEESKRLNMSLNLSISLFKILIDLEERVEAVKPSFPVVQPILDFFKKDLGQQFCNDEQNTRMTELLALFNGKNGVREKKNIANEVQNSIKQDVIPSVLAKVEVLSAVSPIIEASQSVAKAIVPEMPFVNGGTLKKDTMLAEKVANVGDSDKKVEEKINKPSLVTEGILTSKPTTEAPQQKIAPPPVDVNPFGPAPGYEFPTTTAIKPGFGETAIKQPAAVQNSEPPAEIKKKPVPVSLELSAPPPLQPTNVPNNKCQTAPIQTPATSLTPMAPPTSRILETNDFEDMDAPSYKVNFGSKQAAYGGNMSSCSDAGRFGNQGGRGRGRGFSTGGFSGSRGAFH